MQFSGWKSFKYLILAFFAAGLLSGRPDFGRAHEFEVFGVPPQVATDYIYAVIASSRRFYSNQIVDRLGKNLALKATEDWEIQNTLPLPSQFLKLSSQSTNDRSKGFKVRILSQWPIDESNAPLTIFENHALQGLAAKPQEPFTWVVLTGGRWSYQAIYPDIAVSEECVACHNTHPGATKKDYRLGDVLGGVLIQFPLRVIEGPEDRFVIPPEVVSGYIRTIVESDRMVYTKHIVQRLRDHNVVAATETWREDNTLPLPAQFLSNTRELSRRYRPGLDFRLISQWPINYRNGAANEFERNALDAVQARPHRPFYGRQTLGGLQYFQSVFPDYAVTPSCVACHNAHPKSPKRDFHLNDLMGALVVSFTFK